MALRKINIGSGESAVVSQYEIKETPTMIVLDRDGRQMLRYAGTVRDEIRRVSGDRAWQSIRQGKFSAEQ